jgi:hypothetical protein
MPKVALRPSQRAAPDGKHEIAKLELSRFNRNAAAKALGC